MLVPLGFFSAYDRTVFPLPPGLSVPFRWLGPRGGDRCSGWENGPRGFSPGPGISCAKSSTCRRRPRAIPWPTAILRIWNRALLKAAGRGATGLAAANPDHRLPDLRARWAPITTALRDSWTMGRRRSSSHSGPRLGLMPVAFTRSAWPPRGCWAVARCWSVRARAQAQMAQTHSQLVAPRTPNSSIERR